MMFVAESLEGKATSTLRMMKILQKEITEENDEGISGLPSESPIDE